MHAISKITDKRQPFTRKKFGVAVNFVTIHQKNVTRLNIYPNVVFWKPYNSSYVTFWANDSQVSKPFFKITAVCVARCSPVVIARHCAKGGLFNNESRVALGGLFRLSLIVFRCVFAVDPINTLKKRDTLVKELSVLGVECGQTTDRLARKHLLVTDVWLVDGAGAGPKHCKSMTLAALDGSGSIGAGCFFNQSRMWRSELT